MILSTNAKERKDAPVATGVLDYFPLALVEVARLSKAGNDQHNPGQPLHWAKEKSTDHADCLVRHLLERGTYDTDGMKHSAKVAWRALALLQTELEADASKGNTNAIQSTTNLIGPVPSAVLGGSQMGQTMAEGAVSRYAEFSKWASPPGHLIGGQQCGLRLQNCATDYPEHLKAANMLVGDNE